VRVTFYNPETSFSVAQVRPRGRRDPVPLVGTLPQVHPGEWVLARGTWQTDPRHGAQFRATGVEVRPPGTLDDLVNYLGSGFIRLLGPTLARRIVDHFGEATLGVLDTTPGRVREVAGIGAKRAGELVAAWAEHRTLRAVATALAARQVDARFAPRLVAAYGEQAPRVIAANPYRLVADVPGFGFRAADRLGQAAGIRPVALARLQAAVHAAALRDGEAGHTRSDAAALVATAARLADVDPALLAPVVTQLVAGGVLAIRGASPPATPATPLPAPTIGGGGLRVYEPPPPAPVTDEDMGLGLGLAARVRAEEVLARDLRALVARPSGIPGAAVDAWLASDADGRALSAEQRAAVRQATRCGLFVLTGGPGVGKTTTLRALVRCLRALGRTVALAAPTGKAAKRLGDVVGQEAATLHRLLGVGPDGFLHGRRRPLPADTVVVDEASMLDTQLARSVAAAIAPHAQLLLVGDADQLPSVGPGQVLADLLASGVVPAARLTTVFRQAATSAIVRSAHRIRQGELPELAPAEALGAVDLVFIPAPAARLTALAAEWAAVHLPRSLGCPPDEVQTLAPLRRSCQALNDTLQRRLNPARGQAERPHGALPLRVGDRVIQTRNNARLGVVNGDVGLLAAIDAGVVVVDYGDGRVVSYAPADLLDLDHAYAITVHKAQGGEWSGVVLLVAGDHGPLLSRNLLYTGLTRARRAAVIVGDEAAIARAVANTRDRERRTGLHALLTMAGGHDEQG
jgi:exodeoxyribonuclease V alpha subunit